MSAPVLRAGLIGLGRMGRHHARVLRTLHGVDLVGALDPHGDRYRAADNIPVVGDLDALLRIGIDYAVLACPTLLHEPLGTALATVGIPTLIESRWPVTPTQPGGWPPHSTPPKSQPPSDTSNASTRH